MKDVRSQEWITLTLSQSAKRPSAKQQSVKMSALLMLGFCCISYALNVSEHVVMGTNVVAPEKLKNL
jgi:hypothetical protein